MTVLWVVDFCGEIGGIAAPAAFNGLVAVGAYAFYCTAITAGAFPPGEVCRGAS